MKNTLENKVKFFALYIGQKVRLFPANKDAVRHTIAGAYLTQRAVFNCAIELKSISQITDADAAELCRLFTSYFTNDEVAAFQGRQLFSYLKTQSNRTGYDWIMFSDFLRLRGYALPWLGITVDEQVEFGWLKLKVD